MIILCNSTTGWLGALPPRMKPCMGLNENISKHPIHMEAYIPMLCQAIVNFISTCTRTYIPDIISVQDSPFITFFTTSGSCMPPVGNNTM